MPKNITFSVKASNRIETYTNNYRSYCIRQYEDSGIWTENQIIMEYIKNSEEREDHMYATIRTRLERDLPIGHSGHNTIKIPWRTKILHVTYEDIDDEERIILDLEILTQ